LGLLSIFLAVKSFKKAQTTINPLQPDLASFLVTDGVFKYSRNPMYVGMLFILIFISLRFNLIGGSLVTLGFVIYITKYQIVPEEIAMVKLFNDKFIAYKSRVRRWL
jgi:protein-S-isoprenylcysteine O-methyltransferase Ste14